MKVNPRVSPEDIDKLLSSFLDGELPVRQLTEVQRLLGSNKKLALRLDRLRRCRNLLGALPYAQAPAGILESVKASIAANAALAQKAPAANDARGVKHLMLRKLVTAAAMFILVGILAAVVYSIVSPQSPADRPPRNLVAVNSPSNTGIDPGEIVADIRGTLELTTPALAEAGTSINVAIRDAELADFVTIDRQPDKTLYTLTCPRDRLDPLLVRLERDWSMFGPARLVLQADTPTNRVAVAGVTLKQIGEILSQDTEDRRARAAKFFAVATGSPGASIDDPGTSNEITPPKPVFTDDRPTQDPGSQQPVGDMTVSLTLVLTARQ